MPLELHEKYREIRSSAKHRVQEQVQSMGWFTCPSTHQIEPRIP